MDRVQKKQSAKVQGLKGVIEQQTNQIQMLKDQLVEEEVLWEKCKDEGEKYNSEINKVMQELKRRQFFMDKQTNRRCK